MPQVLVGEFGDIGRLGLRAILRASGAEIVGECASEQLVSLVRSMRPDVVVIDQDAPGGSELARQVATCCQPLTVIACSLDQPVMRVYPRGGEGASFLRPLNVGTLVAAARS